MRVQLPDGTSTMIVAEKGQTIRQSLKNVCNQKNIDLKSFDITVGESKQVYLLEIISVMPLPLGTSQIVLIVFLEKGFTIFFRGDF